jgi:RNA polymerase sigma-70 factor (ECF subfamily)
MSRPADRNDRTARFEALFRAQYPAVARYVRRRAEPANVDDLVNEVFLVAWRRLDQVPGDPGPWLLGVARNVLGTYIRGARRVRALHERLASVHVQLTDTDPAIAGTAVATALGRLRPQDCEALMLVNWEGLTPSQAARALGERPATFRVRLHRARSRFRTLVEQSLEQPDNRAGTPGPRPQSMQVTKEIPDV